MKAEASIKDIAWYNNFYKKLQLDFPSWYVYMIDELKKDLKFDSKLLEVGCGQAKALEFLARNQLIDEENISAIDQSEIAVNYAKLKLPKSRIEQGDIYNIEYNNNSFDFILMAEVIEHLEYPMHALNEINRVLKHNGKLLITFPNYYNFPWLLTRILAEKLNKPSWIVLQPVDKIYNTSDIIKFCRINGFSYLKCIGSNYFPPILYIYETPKITEILNLLHLNKLSFHPILTFEKR